MLTAVCDDLRNKKRRKEPENAIPFFGSKSPAETNNGLEINFLIIWEI